MGSGGITLIIDILIPNCPPRIYLKFYEIARHSRDLITEGSTGLPHIRVFMLGLNSAAF